jgi:hypothetical protein
VASGGGHTIKNDSGTSLTQRSNLQFKGVYTKDDSTSDNTEVDIVRTFTNVDDIEALIGEAAKGFQYIDDEAYTTLTGDDVQYDITHTVSDMIDGIKYKTIVDIPADTYNTYALALAAIKTEFDKLSDEEKMRSRLVRGHLIVANIFSLTGRFSLCILNNTTQSVLTYELDSSKYYSSAFGTSGNMTITDNSSSAQSQRLELVLI